METSTIIAMASFIVMLVIQVFSAGIFIGGLVFTVKFVEKQIQELKKSQDKHNCLIERMAVVEQSSKSAHNRIDEIKSEQHHD